MLGKNFQRSLGLVVLDDELNGWNALRKWNPLSFFPNKAMNAFLDHKDKTHVASPSSMLAVLKLQCVNFPFLWILSLEFGSRKTFLKCKKFPIHINAPAQRSSCIIIPMSLSFHGPFKYHHQKESRNTPDTTTLPLISIKSKSTESSN